MRGYSALLRDSVQRRLLASSIPADFSDWLDYVAVVALLVYGWKEGPGILAGFAVALALPYVLIGPLVATLVDRSSIKAALVLTNLGRAAATALLIVAPNAYVVLLLVFLRASIDSAFTPARQAAIQIATPPELLLTANGAHQGINQISKIAGPAIGGLMLGLMPTSGVFAINAALSLVAALALIGLKLPPRATPPEAHQSLLAALPVGFVEFKRNRKILMALIFSAFAFFSFFLYDTLIALLALALGFDQTVFGLSVAISGMGGLLGALVAGAMSIKRPLLLMASSALFSGPITVLLSWATMSGWTVPLWAFLLAMGLMGGSTAFMLVPYRSIVQTETPPDRIARVFAAGEAVTMAVMVTAPFMGSALAARFGIASPFLAGGVVLALVGLVGLFLAARK